MTGHKRPCVVLPCGAGKTILAADIAKRASMKGNRVLYLVHRKELCKQTEDTFASYGVNMGLCNISMVQTVTRHLEDEPEPQLIIQDECFPSGTLIDGKPIETIQAGEFIKSYNHTTGDIEKKKVLNTFTLPMPDRLVKINGSLVCTLNHPIYEYTKGEYVNAGSLKPGDFILRGLQKATSMGEPIQNTERSVSTNKRRESLLLSRVLNRILPSIKFGAYGEDEYEICLRQNETKQSNVPQGYKGKNGRNIKNDRAQTKYKGRERASLNPTTPLNRSSRRNESCYGVRNQNKRTKRVLSTMLQSRYRIFKRKAGCRNRCPQPCVIVEERTRQEERGFLKTERVDSVEVFEQDCNGGYGKGCFRNYVHNLEVEGNQNYFANGILVHNCHHSSSETYKRIYEAFPKAKIVGMTATPKRLDGKGLSEVYDDLLEGVSVKWLIENHYLAPFLYYSMPLADFTNIKKVAGEYAMGDMMDKKIIYGDTVKNYRNWADGQKAIIYCSSIVSAEGTAAEFVSAGYAAAALSCKTPKKIRESAMEDFRAGRTQILCNVDLFGEGVDIADCSVCIMLRKTASLTLFIQQAMRAMRYMPNKTAILIDHVQNYIDHGLPDDEHEWTLEGKKKKPGKPRLKQCPGCYSVIPASEKQCPECGYEFTTDDEDEKETVDVELQEITAEMLAYKKAKYNDYRKCKTFEDLDLFRRAKGFKFFWEIFKAIELGLEIPDKYWKAEQYARQKLEQQDGA